MSLEKEREKANLLYPYPTFFNFYMWKKCIGLNLVTEKIKERKISYTLFMTGTVDT